MQILYKVNPIKVDQSAKYQLGQSIWGTGSGKDFIVFAIVAEIIIIIVDINTGGTFWFWGLIVIAGYFLITKISNDGDDSNYTRKTIPVPAGSLAEDPAVRSHQTHHR